jgi:hypothetical protein
MPFFLFLLGKTKITLPYEASIPFFFAALGFIRNSYRRQSSWQTQTASLAPFQKVPSWSGKIDL